MKVIEHIVLFFLVDRNQMIVVHGTTKQLEFVNKKANNTFIKWHRKNKTFWLCQIDMNWNIFPIH